MLIECDTLTGGKKAVPREELIFRPAAHAIVIDKEGNILLVRTKTTGRF